MERTVCKFSFSSIYSSLGISEHKIRKTNLAHWRPWENEPQKWFANWCWYPNNARIVAWQEYWLPRKILRRVTKLNPETPAQSLRECLDPQHPSRNQHESENAWLLEELQRTHHATSILPLRYSKHAARITNARTAKIQCQRIV